MMHQHGYNYNNGDTDGILLDDDENLFHWF